MAPIRLRPARDGTAGEALLAGFAPVRGNDRPPLRGIYPHPTAGLASGRTKSVIKADRPIWLAGTPDIADRPFIEARQVEDLSRPHLCA